MHIGSTFAKVLALAVFVGSALVTTPAFAASVFYSGFEANSFTGWTEANTGTSGLWTVTSSNSPYSGRYAAHISGNTGSTDDVVRKAVATDTYTNPTLSFMVKATGLDYRKKSNEFDRFFVEYTTNGTTWTLVKEINGENIGQYESLPLGQEWVRVAVSIPAHAKFQVRFRTHFTDTGDRLWLDEVYVSGTPIENTLLRCTDSQDNDGDSYIDALEPECDAFYSDLTVVKEGTGEVSSSPEGISCGFDCMERYLTSAVVTLTQTVTRGFTFAGWSGACSGLGDCSVAMNTDKQVTATFNALPAITLTTANDLPDSGSIMSEPSGIACGTDCEEVLYEGEVLSLTATPSSGFRFVQWSGDCVEALSPVCELLAGTTNLFATAHYAPIPKYLLSVANDLPSNGSVQSTPAGVTCGADCVEEFYEGTGVALVAKPVPGFVFDHWSGDCLDTVPSCTLTMTNHAFVTAHYAPAPPAVCGNGVVEHPEECDDGNLNDNDACLTQCTLPLELVCGGTVSYPICRFQ